MIDIILTANCIIAEANLNNLKNPYRYRWVNVVLEDPQGAPDTWVGSSPQAPYIDPPMHGWKYQEPILVDSIYYFDEAPSSDYYIGNFTGPLHQQFNDCPTDPRLQPGEAIKFATFLVDTERDNEILYQFNWNLNHKEQTTLEYEGRPVYPIDSFSNY